MSKTAMKTVILMTLIIGVSNSRYSIKYPQLYSRARWWPCNNRYAAKGIKKRGAMGFKQPPENTGREHENEGSARRFKKGLVAELWMKDGSFWESIRDVRTRRGIEAQPQLVSGDGPRIGDLVFPQAATSYPSEEFSDFLGRWRQDLISIKDKNIPAQRDKNIPAQFEDAADWNAFISAYVRYDPPEENLLEFASYGDSRIVHAPYTGEPSMKPPSFP
jgi:hypothetical protein